jgi:hypothetical protein
MKARRRLAISSEVPAANIWYIAGASRLDQAYCEKQADKEQQEKNYEQYFRKIGCRARDIAEAKKGSHERDY